MIYMIYYQDMTHSDYLMEFLTVVENVRKAAPQLQR
jgi:hypothetical protein